MVEDLHTLKNNKKNSLNSGKIQLQSAGAEVFFKGIKIRALNHLPEDIQIAAGLK